MAKLGERLEELGELKQKRAGMSSFDPSRFSCTEEWLEARGQPAEISPGSALWDERSSLRRHLWDQHFQSLSESERSLLESGKHPSLSWSSSEEAVPYLATLSHRLEDVDFVAGVELGYSHGDTLVLTVRLRREVPWRELRRHVPELYRGFEVKAVPARN